MPVDLLPPAQVTQPGQVIQPQLGGSQLAAAMMQSQPMASGGGGGSEIPLSSIMKLLGGENGSAEGQDPEMMSRLWNGFDNWLRGYSFDGMAQGDALNGLSGAAAANIAGGAGGL